MRSTDFTDANLTGAKFCHAQAGLQKTLGYFTCTGFVVTSGSIRLFLSFCWCFGVVDPRQFQLSKPNRWVDKLTCTDCIS
ncbi:hypothetical protein [Scytonema sp. PRP1]|uniref:hypothetical protein n=1 Tax=Scytonema sp. PRP1 TaxID=3120513 RepID=UPI00300C1FD4